MKPTLDPHAFFLKEYETVMPAMRFSARRLADAQAWQRKARRKLNELMGDFPAVGGDVPCRTFETVRRDGWSRTRLELETQPGLLANGYYLVPDHCPPKSPAVLCIPGHGYGVDDIVGIDAKGKERTTKVNYQFDYALQCVERGFPVLALELMAFGKRRDPQSIKNDPQGTACHGPSTQALVLGRTITGYRVHDCRRGIDWLSRQPEVDPKRIGMLGISGGGLVTFFTAAVETRIRCAYVSGYLNTFRDSIYAMFHCVDNFIPGILNWFEMSDLAGMVAPRRAFFEGGTRDPIFPIRAFREAKKEVQAIYKAFGVPENCGFHNFDAEHAFNGKRGLPFLEQSLRD